MKKIYAPFILLAFIFLSGCSKDVLKSYDSRIIGTWRITDVNRIGIGGNTSKLSFTDGTFIFEDNGSLTYINKANISFKGRWEIVKRIINNETARTLQVTAVDFTTQQILSAYYDQINFVSTNHFKARITSAFRTYVTHFYR